MKYFILLLILLPFVNGEYLNNTPLLNDITSTQFSFRNFEGLQNDFNMCTNLDGCNYHIGNETVLMNASKTYFFNIVPSGFDMVEDQSLIGSFNKSLYAGLGSVILLLVLVGLIAIGVSSFYYMLTGSGHTE